MIRGRRRSVIFFTVFGICLVAIAVTLNVSWVVLNWRTGVLAILGVILFALTIAGIVLNTIFLVREIRRNEQQDSFLNAVTHELKTPIASIRLYLQTLQTRELDDEKRRDFYRIMLEDSDRLIHTIEQVLRAGSARSRFRREVRTRVDLNEIAGECVALARTRFHLDERSLAYENHAGAAVVLGNAEELKAAVWNLIDNAIKYSPADIRVNVAVEPAERDRVAVRVSDRGSGISSTELKRIFNRFYRTPALGVVRAKGSGLGLFIVRSVARNHGGRAFAESAGAGQGSTLTILLPKAPGV
jgi:two-component system sensor histidine kinase SenX3